MTLLHTQKPATGWSLIAIALFMAGCQRDQLRLTTIDVSSVITLIQQKQVINNLGSVVHESSAIPTQVLLSGGTVQIVSTITPGVSFPLSSMFARTLSATPSLVSTTAGGGATLESDSK